MRHVIETNAPTRSTNYRAQIADICTRIRSEHATRTREIEVNMSGHTIRIIAVCNGAALRDLTAALDHGGWLD